MQWYSIADMGLIGLRVELSALRDAINELRAAIQKHSETAHVTQKTHDKDTAIPKSIPVTVSYVEQVDKDQKASYRTQEGIRKWTRGAVIAASIYAAIAVLQWCEMRKATRAATTATYIAMQQFEASERPWVSINVNIDSPLFFNAPRVPTGVGSPFIPGETGAMITARFTLINTGHTPAEAVEIIPVFYPLSRAHVPLDEQTKACGNGKDKWFPLPLNPSPSNSIVGQTILPGDHLELDETVTAKKKDVDLAVAEFKKQLEDLKPGLGSKVKPKITLFLTGCVVYQSSLTNAAVVGATAPVKPWQKGYQTGFSYDILRNAITNQGFNPEDGNVPEEFLTLVPNRFQGFYAQ